MTSAMFGSNAMSMGASSTSPGQSSPESFEIEEESNAQSAQWQGTEQTSPTSNSQPARAPAPLQKRRRVTRACDECRRKKIKCDGKQPCTHCTVYSYDCTYDQPSNRRRNPAPQYIEALENRLQRAETLLRTVLPNVDLNDPNIDNLIQQRRQASNSKDALQNSAAGKSCDGSDSSEQDAQIRSMIESTGQLDLDEAGHWDFHGGSSGAVFVRRMRQEFGGLLGNDNGAPLFPRIPRPKTPMFNSPRSSTESPIDSGLPNTVDLPSRESAKALCDDSLNKASSLLRFIHQPSFYEMFDSIYDTPPESFGDSENRFLPLLYMVLALGCMFHQQPGENPSDPLQNTYKAGIEQGLKYFRAARNMMDITDCRDITSLQAVLFMIMFLQSSANLSTCYSYIGIALRSALRQGLHRSLINNFNPIELETRRRVFWVIRKMDTYVSALLGFPQMLSNDDIDQELPIEVDDEYITKDGILDMPDVKPSLLFQASNAHTRLMSILAKVIKYIYPTKGLEQSLQGNAKSSYGINHGKIREVEQDLAAWLDKLPMALRPGGDGSPDILRVQQLLRLSYAHVQMMLYRPFLHYVSDKGCAGKKDDHRAYACAAACVSVSRNIVHITAEMKKRGLLVGAYWFTMYTTFFAILSLVYFVLENPDKPESQDILLDANDGKDALDGLARRSQAADRCSSALKGLFERLPERLKDSCPGSAVPKKKRSAPSPNMRPQALHSSPNLSEVGPGLGLPRATTFPVPAPLQTTNLQRSSLDGNRFPINTLSNPNLRQSFMSPTDLSAVGTPDSGSTSNSMHHSRFPLQEPQFAINTAVPDLSAMMFPSADPFAYPNQPMAVFDNLKQENIPMMNNSQIPPMFLSNGTPTPTSGRYDDLQGQLFGPLPPYLTQGQQNYDMNSHLGTGPGMMGGMGQDMNYHTGVTPSNEMSGNFDGFFSGDGDEWSNNLTDHRFG